MNMNDADVYRLRWIDGASRKEVSAASGLTFNQMRTAMERFERNVIRRYVHEGAIVGDASAHVVRKWAIRAIDPDSCNKWSLRAFVAVHNHHLHQGSLADGSA